MMEQKFIIDTQLPHQLAAYLRKNNFDAVHTTDTYQGHLLQDSEIVNLAIEQDRIIISKDSDFFDNYILNGIPPKVLMFQFGNIRNRDLLEIFDHNLENIIQLFDENAGLVIFNRNQLIAY
jgi:predicted nuclease of predicted toxin-antitoxin system